jgi:hypothetical protein
VSGIGRVSKASCLAAAFNLLHCEYILCAAPCALDTSCQAAGKSSAKMARHALMHMPGRLPVLNHDPIRSRAVTLKELCYRNTSVLFGLPNGFVCLTVLCAAVWCRCVQTASLCASAVCSSVCTRVLGIQPCWRNSRLLGVKEGLIRCRV